MTLDKEVEKMSKYVCSVCGYVYDPEAGDPDNGIQPGTPFEKLPDDYSKKFRLRLDKKLLTFNSINHKRRGQSVLFGGSDVIFQTERSELV